MVVVSQFLHVYPSTQIMQCRYVQLCDLCSCHIRYCCWICEFLPLRYWT